MEKKAKNVLRISVTGESHTLLSLRKLPCLRDSHKQQCLTLIGPQFLSPPQMIGSTWAPDLHPSIHPSIHTCTHTHICVFYFLYMLERWERGETAMDFRRGHRRYQEDEVIRKYKHFEEKELKHMHREKSQLVKIQNIKSETSSSLKENVNFNECTTMRKYLKVLT